MARTKKEPLDQVPEEAHKITDADLTESEQLPQTDLEQPAAALADLELAATTTLDPDAPQTGPELGEALDGQSRPRSLSRRSACRNQIRKRIRNPIYRPMISPSRSRNLKRSRKRRLMRNRAP